MAIDPQIANPAGLQYAQNALINRQNQQQQGFQNNLAIRDQGLQEQAFQAQQNQLVRQQTQTDETEKLKYVYAATETALRSKDPYQTIMGMAKQDPTINAFFQMAKIDPNNPDQVLGALRTANDHSRSKLGIMPEAPPTQMETIQGPDGALLQRDPTTGKMTQVMGRGVQRQEVTNMTPYQAGQLDIDRQRLALDREKTKATTTGPGNVTEGERKAAALGTRLESAMQALTEVERAEPGASRPTYGEKAAGVFGETAANFARGPNRQQADAAQLDALDAALTLATGAAYTKEQLSNLRKSYFPQLGDSPENVAAKQKRFALIVETARIASGRAEPAIDQAVGGSPRQPSGQPRVINFEDLP